MDVSTNKDSCSKFSINKTKQSDVTEDVSQSSGVHCGAGENGQSAS